MTSDRESLPDDQLGRRRYPGTRPFSESAEDCARFFGRDDEGEQLYLRVLSVSLLVQFGKSGLGKTSLLQASLFPRLRQRQFLPVIVRLNDPHDTLVAAVARSIQESCALEGLDAPAVKAEGLWELLSGTLVWRDERLLTPVLVFDQFEEVFTLRDPQFRAELAEELGALASGIAPQRLRAATERTPAKHPSVKIVISLREDYLGSLQEFSTAIPGLFDERLRLEPMTEAAARKAIVGPAGLRAGPGEAPYWAPPIEFEDAALEGIISYLKGSSGVIEPFQLQLLCRHVETIAQRKSTPGTDSVQLTLADLGGSAGFASVLNNFYCDALNRLPRSQRKKAAELCEEGLLDASGHRLMLEEGQIRRIFRLDADTLAALSAERLVHRERRLESVFYEISHDRLAESIFAARRFRLPLRVRRRLAAAAVVAVCAFGALVYVNVRVGDARDRAETARNRSEALISFLLGEKFLGGVRDIGRSDLLRQVRDQVKAADAHDQDTPLNRGLALRIEGETERVRGSLAKTVAKFGQALNAMALGPNDNRTGRELAHTHEDIGDALSDQGHLSEALGHLEAAIKIWRKVISSARPPELTDCFSLAEDLVEAGELRHQMAEATTALSYSGEALNITSSTVLGFQPPTDACAALATHYSPYPEARALEVFSEAAPLRARIIGSSDDFKGGEGLQRKANWLRPFSISTMKNTLTATAQAQNWAQPQLQRALDADRNLLEGFSRMLRWDSGNRLWRREKAATQLLLVEVILACNANTKKGSCKPMPSLNEAEDLNLEAIGVMRRLVADDPGNVSWRQDLAWCWLDRARVQAVRGRQSEQLVALETAADLYRRSPTEDADANATLWLASVWSEKSAALRELHRTAEAATALQESIRLLKKRMAAGADDPDLIVALAGARQSEADIDQKLHDTDGAARAASEEKQLRSQYDKLTRADEEEVAKLDASSRQHEAQADELYKKGDYAAALGELKFAASDKRETIAHRPSEYARYDDLWRLYKWVNDADEKLGNSKEALAAIGAAMHSAQFAAWLAPDHQSYNEKEELRDALNHLGQTLYGNSVADPALSTKVLPIVQEELVTAADSITGDRANDLYRLGDAKLGLGMVLRKLKKCGWEEALQRSLVDLEEAVRTAKTNPDYYKEVGTIQSYFAQELDRDGRTEDATARFHSALEAYGEAQRRNPRDAGMQTAIQQIQSALAQRPPTTTAKVAPMAPIDCSSSAHASDTGQLRTISQ